MLRQLRLLRRLPPSSLPRRPPPPFTAAVGAGASRTARRVLPHQRTHRFASSTRAALSSATGVEAAAAASSSPYISVDILCNKLDAIALSEALMCFGACSASMDETKDLKDYDKTSITSIFADGQDVHTRISHAADSIGLNYVPNYEVSVMKQCDWMTNVQETFHPVEVTKGLWIVPEWKSPVDFQATNVILNPGMAFGTGEHPTTMLCLLLLHGLIKGGECLLDYGTGSGVLGIAAIKMGAALAVGLDIDPEAVKSARHNMALNGIDCDRMQVYLVPVDLNAEREKFEIVVANILLNPLLELVEDIVGYGKPGAVVGISGILSEQVEQVRQLYSRYLNDISVSEMDGWACLSGIKKDVMPDACKK